MYFSWLHKKTPEKCSINVLKNKFLVPFRVLEFFSTVRNDQIFLFSKTLPETCFGINLCILVNYTRNHSRTSVSMSSKQDFWDRFGFSNFLRLFVTTEFFFFLGLFQRLISAWTHVFWLITQEITRKLQYECPQKKIFWSVSGSRFFFDCSKRPNFSFF